MPAREPRIDIIRGFSILVILVNHLTQVVEFGGLRGWTIPTPTQYGYSSAAELFVIMSGYMVGLVYMRRPDPAQAIWRRAARLWVYDAILLGFVLPAALAMPMAEMQFWRLEGFASAPVMTLIHFLTLRDAPRLLDILQLYIRLMLIAPLAIWLYRKSPVALIATSAGLYVAAQLVAVLRLAASPDANTDGALDLLSWQMLFFVPMALGARRVHVPLFKWIERSRAVLPVSALLFAGCAIAMHLEAKGVIARPEWLTGRYGLTPLRVTHAVVVLMLYAGLLTRAMRLLDLWPFRAVGAVGRHSLLCFIGGVVLTYGLGTLWLRVGDRLDYYVFAGASVALTIILASFLEMRRLRGRVTKARAKAPAREVCDA